MWTELIGGLAGAVMGAHRTDRDEDPQWKLMANTTGGALLGALGGHYVSGGAQVAQTAGEGGAVGAGSAGAGSGAAYGGAAGGAGLGGAYGGAAIAGGSPATAGVVGAGTGTATVAATQPQVIQPVLAEGIAEIPANTQLVNSSGVAAGGEAAGTFNSGAGLSAPNTTGADPGGLFNNVPQYMRYGGEWGSLSEKAGYYTEQAGLDNLSSEDLIEMFSMLRSNGQDQQGQQQQRPQQQQVQPITDQQLAEMYANMDAQLLDNELSMNTNTMNGGLDPSLFETSGDRDADSFMPNKTKDIFGLGNKEPLYASLFNDEPDDYGWYI